MRKKDLENKIYAYYLELEEKIKHYENIINFYRKQALSPQILSFLSFYEGMLDAYHNMQLSYWMFFPETIKEKLKNDNRR